MSSHSGAQIKMRKVKVVGLPSTARRKSSGLRSINIFPGIFQHTFGRQVTPSGWPNASFSVASQDPSHEQASPPLSKIASLRTASQQLMQRVRPAAQQLTLPTLNWKHRFRREVWRSAFRTLMILLRNTCISIACAWFANFCFSLGNVFALLYHHRSVRDQSNGEFIVATLLWIHTFFCGMVVISQAPMLLSMRFQRCPEYKPTFAFCVWKLLKKSLSVYLSSLLLIVGILVLFRTVLSPASRHSKPEFYLSLFCNHIGTCGIILAVRRIFKEETVQSQQLAASRSSSQSLRSGGRRKSSHCTFLVYFWKFYVRMSPMVLTVVFAAAYVHVVSRYQFEKPAHLLAFTLGSLALKLLVQEVAKVGMLRRKIKDVRTMFFAVGLPTVLIDTQVRIALQRVQSTQLTLSGTFVMALLEIATRIGKVIVLNAQMRRRQRRVLAQDEDRDELTTCVAQVMPPDDPVTGFHASTTAVVAVDQAPPEPGRHWSSQGLQRIRSLCAPRSRRRRTITPRDLRQWRKRILAFQVAELYADMSAEYIAIGCSTSILFFYWTHPKYELGGPQVRSTSMWRQSKMLAIQVAVEILVDFLSCLLEIGEGIEFREVRKYHLFLGSLFIGIAIVNVQISAMLYIHTW